MSKLDLLGAMSQLTSKELCAFNALRSGLATSKRHAMEIAGYSEKFQRQSGKVFANPRMAAATKLALEVDSLNASMDSAVLLDRLIDLAQADPKDIYDESGAVRPLREWPKALRLQMKSIDLNIVGGIEKVQFHKHLDVLALIGKHRMVSAFTDERGGGDRVYIVRDWTGQGLAKGEHADQEVIDVGSVADLPPAGTHLPTGTQLPQGKTDQAESDGGTPGSATGGSSTGRAPTSNIQETPEISESKTPQLELDPASVDKGMIPTKRKR